MRRAVWVLGILAVLGVLASATLAATHRTRPAASGRQWLRAYGVEVAVPAARWRLTPKTDAIRYDARALVRAPAVLDAGFCPSARGTSRAFVGLLPPERGSIARAVNGELGTWASAIWSAPIPLPQVTGPRADVDLQVAPGPCAPITAHLTLLGRSTDAGVVVLVLVRDVGEPGDLTAAEAETILDSVRRD